MIVFKPAADLWSCKPGQWVLDLDKNVYLRCPHKEGHGFVIRRDSPAGRKAWAIAADGKVKPSVKIEACGFHEFIRLADWKEDPA